MLLRTDIGLGVKELRLVELQSDGPTPYTTYDASSALRLQGIWRQDSKSGWLGVLVSVQE